MDQIKIGKFIAELRKKEGLTQEALGEKVGVTNKTVSRWETGVYMPDIEMLQILSKEFNVSINEILAGKLLSDEEFRKAADENIVEAAKSDTFSLNERKAFYMRKWRRDHAALLVILAVIVLLVIAVPALVGKAYISCIAPVVALVFYGYQNNEMMKYVEKSLYD